MRGSVLTHFEATLAGRAGEPIVPTPVLAATLERLSRLTDGLLAGRTRSDLRRVQDRLAQNRLNLVVLGEFKRGKSTLINALLQRDLLPTGVVPLTSAVTVIGCGAQDRLIVRFNNGTEAVMPIDTLPGYVTESGNPHNRLGVDLVTLELDHELLQHGISLVDTPGIGSIHSHNTQTARGFLPQVDAALCVLDAGQPVTEVERQLLADAGQRVPRLLIIVNKIDHLEFEDREVALEFVRESLQELPASNEAELLAVSARSGDGLSPLRERLRRLAAQERESVLVRSAAGLARLVALEGAHAARFEAGAVRMPLDELTFRARDFERQIAQLHDAGEEAGVLLQRGTERAIQRLINEPLQEHAHREEANLRAALRSHVADLGRLTPRELSGELDGWIEETIRAEFDHLADSFEEAVAAEVVQLETRYAGRVHEILHQVQAVAEDAFGMRAGEALPQTGLRAPSRFSFKLHDTENALDMLVGFGRTIAPGRLGRRLLIREAEQRLIEMADRHAGRLRSELAERVTRAVEEYRRDLSETVADAVNAIRSAVDRALEERRSGEERSAARLRELADIERQCVEVADDVDHWLHFSTADRRGGK